MRQAFSEQLDAVFDDLAAMAGDVRLAVSRGTQSLLEGDAVLAEAVISEDAEIDLLREKVEDRCFALLSLQQPVAGDLRTLVAALRIVAELERMGDLAVHAAKIARLRIPSTAVPEPAVPLVRRMADVAEEMVARTAEVIEGRDAELAATLTTSEAEMDLLREQLFRDLLSTDWSHGVEAAVDLALLGRYYERIGDHALSVANRVVYVMTGRRDNIIN